MYFQGRSLNPVANALVDKIVEKATATPRQDFHVFIVMPAHPSYEMSNDAFLYHEMGIEDPRVDLLYLEVPYRSRSGQQLHLRLHPPQAQRFRQALPDLRPFEAYDHR